MTITKILALIGMAMMLAPAVAMSRETAHDNYNTYCVQCHGMQGNGMGVNIRDMSVQPRDHTDAKAMSARSDDDLFKVIKEGGLSVSKSALMPPWGSTFTDSEIHGLVKYLRKLCKCKHGG